MSSKEDATGRGWTIDEKKKLLELMKYHGHTNYDRIALEFPNKSSLGIKAKINKYLALSKTLKPGSLDPLDFWLYSFFQPEDDSLISRALLFIQLFENHPESDESNGIEFDTIYGLLHRLTLGHPPNNISPQTFDVFDKEMLKAIEFVMCKSEKEVLTYLSTLSIKKKPTKDYSRKTS
ncbi:uncharacterized protein LOC122508024 [Leptopilina heterotoma]|uniref:uncharacterized protein LOC122508024 n=1 Tax=Leptopilina heterotoma TaxID=63436 RepID=UPI001CA7CD5A|nr:uncharacterized protein LOC122508024 [Leptopilina heterotoma]XP_043477029.1 uncharacterized protein LOC122508024 [Leptopilina heterotoma]